MKILIVQFRRKLQARKRELENFQKIFNMYQLQVEIEVIDGIKESINPKIAKKYSRVIMGGSELSFEGENEPEEIKKLAREVAEKFKDFVFYLTDSSIPSLSICFSHQLFGYVFGSTVRRDKCKGKVGSFLVEVLPGKESDPIFAGLPDKFYANYMHQDVLCRKPQEAVVLAKGERCRCAIMKYGKNSYTTQFHPELTDKALSRLLKMYPHYARFERKPADKLIKDVKDSHKILKNFITQF